MASPSAVRDAGTSFIGGRIPMWVPVLLGFLTAVGPISTDIYLPAFPAMEHMSPEEQARTRQNLLRYCELDTYAMVKVWEKLCQAVT